MKILSKSIEHLQSQAEEVNELRRDEGRELMYPTPDDFYMSEQQLKVKYGKQYDEYKEDLKRVVEEKIMNAHSEADIHVVALDLLGTEKYGEFKEELDRQTIKELTGDLSTLKKIVYGLIAGMLSLSVVIGAGGAGMEMYSRYEHGRRIGVGKMNPIMAAQSSDGLIFKADNGITLESNRRGDAAKHEEFGSIEQVLVHPDSVKVENEIAKADLTSRYDKGLVSLDEYKEKLWSIENSKQQGFLDAYADRLLTFDELVDQIKSAGERGIPTTLNFGDSSTSGWNSNVLTRNSIEVARTLFPKLKELDPSLPDSFDEYVKQKHGVNEDIETNLSLEAERLKQHKNFQQVWNENWNTIRGEMDSPFMTYDTYSDKMAQIDTGHHYVNLGVPGFSSLHGKAYARRIVSELQERGVLKHVDSATIYFGNNDSVNNGNIQDKYFIGDDVKTQFHAAGIIKERFPKVFNTTRVALDDFKDNLQDIVEELKENGIQNITIITPVVPYEWEPGQRAVGDAQEFINEQYKRGGRVSELFKDAKEKFADYHMAGALRTGGKMDVSQLRSLALEAVESDYMVPRRKLAYVKMMAEVAASTGAHFINIESVLPIHDRVGPRNGSPKDPSNATNDYCHPGEHVNILLAAAQTLANGADINVTKKLARMQLEDLGINSSIAEDEIDKVINSCVVRAGSDPGEYKKLSAQSRTRLVWNDK